MKKLVIFFILIESLVSCNPYHTHIGDGYYLCSDKEYGVDYLEYNNKDLSRKDTTIYYDSLRVAHVISLDTCNHWDVVVRSYVAELEDNDDFILVKQKPKDKYKALVKTLDWDTIPYEPYDGFRDHYKFYEYWIIKKKANEIYGPLSQTLYNQYRKELNVPDDLLLLSEKSPKAQAQEIILGICLSGLGVIAVYFLIGLAIVLPIVGICRIIRLIRKKR